MLTPSKIKYTYSLKDKLLVVYRCGEFVYSDRLRFPPKKDMSHYMRALFRNIESAGLWRIDREIKEGLYWGILGTGK